MVSAGSSVFRTNSWKRGASAKSSFAPDCVQRCDGILRLGQVVQREFANAFLAVDGHEDRRHQRDERLVGADVRGRLFTADVLLARREREDEAARAVACRWSRRPGGRASGAVFFFRRDDAAVRTAVAERDAEGLRLHGDDVCLFRRTHYAERDGFRDRDDQERAFLVHDLGDGGNVFDDAEEVRRLDEHARRFVCEGGVERVQIDAAVFAVANFCCRCSWCCA